MQHDLTNAAPKQIIKSASTTRHVPRAADFRTKSRHAFGRHGAVDGPNDHQSKKKKSTVLKRSQHSSTLQKNKNKKQYRYLKCSKTIERKIWNVFRLRLNRALLLPSRCASFDYLHKGLHSCMQKYKYAIIYFEVHT